MSLSRRSLFGLAAGGIAASAVPVMPKMAKPCLTINKTLVHRIGRTIRVRLPSDFKIVDRNPLPKWSGS